MTSVTDLFVGREKELAKLQAGLSAALDGEGRLFLIAGEPGIGKTRLVEKLAAEAGASHGARALWGRCWEGDGGPAFWPWTQCMRSYVADSDASVLSSELGMGGAVLAHLVPEIRRKLPELPIESLPADAEQARFLLFDAAVSLLRSASCARPLLVILDDLHWADQPSLLLLRFLARNLRDARILIVGAYRDVELRSATGVEGTLADLSRETRYIALRGLSLDEVRQFIESSGDDAAGDSMAKRIHATTEGNPLFVAELLRLLADTSPEERKRMLAGRLPVPTAVRTAVGRHVASLSAECRALLAVASVIGREFELSSLGRIVGGGKSSTILEQADEAIRAGVATRIAGSLDGYRFSHALVRETLYDDLGVAERARLHRLVGEALEAVHGSATDAPLAELAHHFFEAAVGGEIEKAIHYSKRAAEEAMGLLAYEEAARHFERALGLVKRRRSSSESERCELLLRLGESLWAFDLERSKKVLFEAARLAEKLGDGERLARAGLALGGAYGNASNVGMIDAEQISLLERALVAVGEGETVLRAKVMGRLAVALHFSATGGAARAQQLGRQALDMTRRVGDKATLASMFRLTWTAIWTPDNADEILGSAREVTMVASEISDRSLAMLGRLVCVALLLDTREFEAAKREGDLALELARGQPDSVARLSALTIPLMRAALEGRFVEAAKLTGAVLSLAEETGSQLVFQIFVSQKALLRRQQGRAAETLDEVRSLADKFVGLPICACLQAAVCADVGKEAETRQVIETLADEDFAVLPRDHLWLASMTLLTDAVDRVDDRRHAAVLYDLLRPYGDRVATAFVYWCYGSIARPLGLLAAMLERFDEAESHFERALDHNIALGSPPSVAQTAHDYARMLLARGGPGDRKKASDLATRALATSRELGMKELEARLVALDVIDLEKAAEPTTQSSFRKEGTLWAIEFGGEVFRLRDAKGLRYIAALLDQPGIEIHAAELAGLGRASTLGDAGEMLDRRAREDYRRRLEELRGEAEEAEGFNDLGRAAKARSEIEVISRELSAAFGLGGRARRASSDAERARLMVTQRIKAALRKIEEASPALARHLGQALRTGLFCRYEPQSRVSWKVS